MNFGALTKHLFHILETKYDTKVHCNKEVVDVDLSSKVDWCAKVQDLKTDTITQRRSRTYLYWRWWRKSTFIGEDRCS